jgi:glycosyltransferase involved in cell wall biosynthesis
VTPKKKRILILSHGHPDISRGGAEHTAYIMYREFLARPDWEPMFVAAGHRAVNSHSGTLFSQHSRDGRELLFHTECDYFRIRQRNAFWRWNEFSTLLDGFRPDVVHFHHYTNLGVESLRLARNWSASVPIVLTLHEYLAICNQQGQMVTRGGHELCTEASPAACARCFPDIAPGDFLLRELYIQALFQSVDLFVSPSEFLKTRYVAWGLPERQIMVLENGQEPVDKLAPRTVREGELRGRFGFFGQINPFKGLPLLLEALDRIERTDRELAKNLSLVVHGAGLDQCEPAFAKRLRKQLGQAQGRVAVHGGYDRTDLPALFGGLDWVIVPSIWWENSPLVIQEAFKYGRPVIASNIGGMKEKVVPGVGGRLFNARNAADLAACLVRAAEDVEGYERLWAGLPVPPSVGDRVDAQVRLYAGLWEEKRRVSLRVVG